MGHCQAHRMVFLTQQRARPSLSVDPELADG